MKGEAEMETSSYIDDLDIEDIPVAGIDSLLESLSLDIMESNINNQIFAEIGIGTDFLDTVLLKFNTIKKYASDESVRKIQEEMIAWADKLAINITNKYSLGYMLPSEDSMESLDTLEALYHFFVLDRHRHTVNFFVNYISINKNRLIETMELDKKGNDITSMANRKRNMTKTATIISANLVEILEHIVEYESIGPDEFFNYTDDGDLYLQMIRTLFDSCTLAGDFFPTYVSQDTSDFTNDMAVELRIALRSMLLNDTEEGEEWT